MAYIYNKILKAENHDFCIQQIKKNSRMVQVIAESLKPPYSIQQVMEIDDKTNRIVSQDLSKFKKSTIEKLMNRLDLTNK